LIPLENSMPPRIGVYPVDDCLIEALSEECFSVNNRELVFYWVVNPLFDIRQDYEAGHNRYVLRERFRQWEERVDEEFGMVIGFPEWGEFINDEEWASMLYDYFLDDYEWALLGSMPAIEHVIAAAAKEPWDCEATDLVTQLLEVEGVEELLLLDFEDMKLYVIRSCRVGDCGLPDLNESFAFPDIRSAVTEGNSPTYLLPEKLLEAYSEIYANHQKWEAEHAKRQSA
jgi:hypothetical protein